MLSHAQHELRCKWQSPSRHSLLLLGATVVLLLVGLLGMHAMGGAGSSHGASGSGHTGIAIAVPTGHALHNGIALDQQHATPAGSAAAPTAERCAEACQGTGPLSPGHAELMACVLALLVGLLVVIPPGRLGMSWLPRLRIATSPDASAVQLEAPRPSLILLSISRT